MTNKTHIRIGGAAGYWGDSPEAPRQLVERGKVDYLVFDYLAEVTMSILVRAREKDPGQGYARDFVTSVMKPLLPQIKAQGIRVVVNAGGVNVTACAEALRTVATEAGLSLKIATVAGDDILPLAGDLRAEGVQEMFSGQPLPDHLLSANAYLGAFPIAAALDAGSEVVITGRCVDSAVTLGALIHEFGWQADEYDKLAAGTLAGHILECGAQATGGNFTDWRDVAAGWDDMGYPIAVCYPDGRFEITKPAETHGLVSRLSVGEQILYETSDTAAYVVPDVVCDYSQALLTEVAPDRVAVSGVRGRAPTRDYKVSATYMDGYRATALALITGFDAVDKAEAYYSALIRRMQRLFSDDGQPAFSDTALHLIGAETLWGQNARPGARACREVVAQIEVRHPNREAIDRFTREVTGVALSMTTGRASVGVEARPKTTPVVAQFAFLIDKHRVPVSVALDGQDLGYAAPDVAIVETPPQSAPAEQPGAYNGPTEERCLLDLAVARSGDKGNSANIGLMARRPEYYDVLRREVTADKVQTWFAHVVGGKVTRFEAPGMMAMNFLLTETLGGGGTSSLHLDKLAKTYGQQILAMPIQVPVGLVS